MDSRLMLWRKQKQRNTKTSFRLKMNRNKFPSVYHSKQRLLLLYREIYPMNQFILYLERHGNALLNTNLTDHSEIGPPSCLYCDTIVTKNNKYF